MSGNYMDAPATRLAYDRDGSVGAFFTSSGLMTQLTAAQLRALNAETETGVPFSSQDRAAIIFPAPVDVSAVFLASSDTSVTWMVQTSKDTTTGLDGTWTTHATGLNRLLDVKPNYRISNRLVYTIAGGDSQGVRGVRVGSSAAQSSNLRALHIYADVSSFSTLDRLAFWHPTLDVEVPAAFFDWGDVPRGTSADKTFRIKNLSGDLTATGIQVFVDALTPGTPSVAAMHTISTNGGSTFLASGEIASIPPGGATSQIIVRRIVPVNAQVSVWSARIAADVTNWTS